MFFFEKKNQKTFALRCLWPLHVMVRAGGPSTPFALTSVCLSSTACAPSNSRNRQKFFAELFFKKATSF
jgi:hypothetical protein